MKDAALTVLRAVRIFNTQREKKNLEIRVQQMVLCPTLNSQLTSESIFIVQSTYINADRECIDSNVECITSSVLSRLL